jgi:membrane-associated phospholipid phosphatase
MLRKTLIDNKIFLIPYLILLICLVPFPLIYEKGQIHLFINQYHHAFSDVLFALLTFLGDGLFLIIPVIILLFISLRHVVFITVAYFSTGIVTQILKRVFFEDVLRPSKFLKDVDLYLIEGVDMLSGRSFPSGHSTSAFALFISLALISKKPYIKLSCFVIACLVAFSRVYLSQHFLIDIMAGSFIGCIGALAFYQLFYYNERSWYSWKIQKALGYERNA